MRQFKAVINHRQHHIARAARQLPCQRGANVGACKYIARLVAAQVPLLLKAGIGWNVRGCKTVDEIRLGELHQWAGAQCVAGLERVLAGARGYLHQQRGRGARQAAHRAQAFVFQQRVLFKFADAFVEAHDKLVRKIEARTGGALRLVGVVAHCRLAARAVGIHRALKLLWRNVHAVHRARHLAHIRHSRQRCQPHAVGRHGCKGRENLRLLCQLDGMSAAQQNVAHMNLVCECAAPPRIAQRAGCTACSLPV